MSTKFDDLAKTLELQAEIVRDFRTLSALNAGIASALARQLASIAGDSQPDLGLVEPKPKARKRTESPAYDKIAAFFLENGNPRLTKADIASGTGLSDGTLHSVLYTSRKDNFENAPNPAGGRERVFSLTKEAYEEAKEQLH